MGGRTEPIIPVRRGGRIDPGWEQLLAVAGVAGLVDVDAGVDGGIAAARLGIALTPLAHIDRGGTTMFTSNPMVLPAVDPRQAPIIATQRRELWEVVSAGDVTEEHAAFLEKEHLPVTRPSTDDQVARAVLRRGTLLDRTVVGFGETRTAGNVVSHPALIWVAKRNGYQDCLWFWNMRALRSLRLEPAPMILLQADGVQHWVGFDQLIADALTRPDEFDPDADFNSRGLPDSALHSIAATLGLTLHIMATVQLRHATEGRAYYDRKKASGKTSMESMRCLKRRLSDIVYRHMVDDAVRTMTGPGGHKGTSTNPA